ncbi:MAG: hypothetical protein HC921_18770 [Synechococcaceae cyanobacterium SM2_3_1]|nr:hypothetical protein [Synechococcaceae cyanobacterium SM2_3_1]
MLVLACQISGIGVQARSLVQVVETNNFIDVNDIKFYGQYAWFVVKTVKGDPTSREIEETANIQYFSMRCAEPSLIFQHSRQEWDELEALVLSGWHEKQLLNKAVPAGPRGAPLGERLYQLVCHSYVTSDSKGLRYYIHFDSFKEDEEYFWLLVERRPRPEFLPSKDHLILNWSIDCKSSEVNNHTLDSMMEVEHLLSLAQPIEEKVAGVFVDLFCKNKLTIPRLNDGIVLPSS